MNELKIFRKKYGIKRSKTDFYYGIKMSEANEIMLNIMEKIENNYGDKTNIINNLIMQKTRLEKRIVACGSGNMEFEFITQKELEVKRKYIAKLKYLIKVKEIQIDSFQNLCLWMEYPQREIAGIPI